MTSTQSEIEVSYDISNEFFNLWLDENMHYTSASYLTGDETLEQAQIQKCRILADYAEITPESYVLDIGCGWGSNLEYLVRERGVKRAHGITLSTAQCEWIHAKGIDAISAEVCDYALYEPKEKFDALVSIEMIDHLCSPAQSHKGMAVELYRTYFNKVAQWVEPGSCFGFQAILRNRIPRTRKDLEDLAFTADDIFPGGLNPRL
ncbi:MAG: class I SAM-dependent methyltransferase, partial [Myxococcota bacterium]